MAKKPSSKGGAAKAPSAETHRQRAAELRAKARMHEAKADLMEVKNPQKAKNQMYKY